MQTKYIAVIFTVNEFVKFGIGFIFNGLRL